ncbi:MAG: FAD:protein FMN transferase [Sediminispirochaetaceae bacterium]
MRNTYPGQRRKTIRTVHHSFPVLLAALGVMLTVLITGCGTGEPEEVTANDFALGTTCSIKLFGTGNRKHLQPALDIAKGVEEKMSVHLEGSEISRVNEQAGEEPVQVSEETFALVQRAYQYSAMGEGIFDLTIGPLVSLWDIGSGNEKVPEDQEVGDALQLVDYHDLILDHEEKRIGLRREGMRIDLGAIAKGYAAALMVEYLEEQGVSYGIINLGGNVYAFGEKNGSGPWKIGIQSPDDERGRYIGVLEIRDRAVVTSGKYERYFTEEGRRYHHILNTENGYPVENGIASVSIVSVDATAADALSTLVFGLGLEKGLRLSEELEDVEAIIITEADVVYTTSGLRDSFRLTDSRYDRGEARHLIPEERTEGKS